MDAEKHIKHIEMYLDDIAKIKETIKEELEAFDPEQKASNEVLKDAMQMVSEQQAKTVAFIEAGRDIVNDADKINMALNKLIEREAARMEREEKMRAAVEKLKEATLGKMLNVAKRTAEKVTAIHSHVMNYIDNTKNLLAAKGEVNKIESLVNNNQHKTELAETRVNILMENISDESYRLEQLKEMRDDIMVAYKEQYEKETTRGYEQKKAQLQIDLGKATKAKDFYERNPIGKLINKFSKEDKVQGSKDLMVTKEKELKDIGNDGSIMTPELKAASQKVDQQLAKLNEQIKGAEDRMRELGQLLTERTQERDALLEKQPALQETLDNARQEVENLKDSQSINREDRMIEEEAR